MTDRWYSIFAFARDGITGTELLGIVMVFGMVALLSFVQLKNSGSSKRVDFSWMFLDTATGKVSRSGFMVLGGFLLGTWVIVDAEAAGRLDWGSFAVFLSYCAGVRALEVLKPKDPAAPPDDKEK